MDQQDKQDFMLQNSKKLYEKYLEICDDLKDGTISIKSDFNEHDTAVRLILRNEMPFMCFDSELYLLEYIIQINSDARFNERLRGAE
jgi:hypothetical protein